MGYMCHHAIIVTSWEPERIERAREVALDTFPHSMVSSLSGKMMNYVHSFAIFPDGSKEGWEESNLGDSRRVTFIEWLDGQRHEDGSSKLDWVEVQFADDDGETKTTRDSDHAGGAKELSA